MHKLSHYFVVIAMLGADPEDVKFVDHCTTYLCMVDSGESPINFMDGVIQAVGVITPTEMETGDWRKHPGLHELYLRRMWDQHRLVQLVVLVMSLVEHIHNPLPSRVLETLKPLMVSQADAEFFRKYFGMISEKPLESVSDFFSYFDGDAKSLIPFPH